MLRDTIPDEAARTYAETTFDRNVVVLAGAGTGKTTLLVNRLVHALMREPQPCGVTQVLALTFTNKAATEMKLRLRERLAGLLACARRDESGTAAALQLEDLRRRYGLSSSQVAERAAAGLRDLEKAQIGTLHSFAAHVLRLHPIEAGVDPGFREDDGDRFEEHFREQWDRWIWGELGPNGASQARWRRLLGELGLDELRGAGRALCSDLVPLERLRPFVSTAAPPEPVRAWLRAQGRRAAELLAAHARAKPRKLETLLDRARLVFEQVDERGAGALAELDPSLREDLARDVSGAPAGWTEPEFKEAQRLVRVAKQLLAVDHAMLQELLDLLAPLARRVRESFLAAGWISFDGLLARAQALLRDQPSVRERLKRAYRTILIDEFQDTDPVQYELVLYLAERPGRSGRDWADLELEAGKLFIVGDPKQSIYAFRRADVEAFHRVVGKIEQSGGSVRDLVTNFRSDAVVLQAVNGVFDALFRAEPNVQPANVHLQAHPLRRASAPDPGVEVRLVRGADDEEFDAAAATRAEAEALARWLGAEVLGRDGVRPGHVALLFRKLTQAQEYLDALRRHGIPHVTDGEKHFYRRQEIIDLVNVLRAVEDPRDRIGLAGVLRSPLGGVTDRELYELAQRQALDYRRTDRLSGWESPRIESVRPLYERLGGLARTLPRQPLPEALDALFEALPLLELAAASLHGEQAVANLRKVRQLAAALADRPSLSLAAFVELLMHRLAEEPDETEGALGEASLEAVQVLTIHKAKGLEFPVVVLPGLHQGSGSSARIPTVAADWSTGVLGLTVGGRRTLGSVLVAEKAQAREEAERRRVLYVGMTRAMERLVLSGGLPARRVGGTFLDLLAEAGWPVSGETADHPGLVIVQAPALRAGRKARPRGDRRPPADYRVVLARWEERRGRHDEARRTPAVITPTQLLGASREPGSGSAGSQTTSDRARLIGVVTHRVLEQWDYAAVGEELDRGLEAACRLEHPSEWPVEEREQLVQEVRDVLRAFMGSPAYQELQRATILGREVPFAVPWDPRPVGSPPSGACTCPAVMSGVVDLLYRLDGEVWVADYKTDRLGREEVQPRSAIYAPQVRAYGEAVGRALGLEKVRGKLIFLRHGLAVEV